MIHLDLFPLKKAIDLAADVERLLAPALAQPHQETYYQSDFGWNPIDKLGLGNLVSTHSTTAGFQKGRGFWYRRLSVRIGVTQYSQGHCYRPDSVALFVELEDSKQLTTIGAATIFTADRQQDLLAERRLAHASLGSSVANGRQAVQENFGPVVAAMNAHRPEPIGAWPADISHREFFAAVRAMNACLLKFTGAAGRRETPDEPPGPAPAAPAT